MDIVYLNIFEGMFNPFSKVIPDISLEKLEKYFKIQFKIHYRDSNGRSKYIKRKFRWCKYEDFEKNGYYTGDMN